MDCFARQTALKHLLTVVHANSQIVIQISASNAIYQATLHSDRLPPLFASLHLQSLHHIYQNLKQSQQGMDFVCYLDPEREQVGMKVAVRLQSTGDLIQKKLLLQTERFLTAKSTPQLKQIVKSLLDQQLTLRDFVKRKELENVSEKVENFEFGLKYVKDEVQVMKKKMKPASEQSH